MAVPIHTPSALDITNPSNLERLMREVVAEVNRIQSVAETLTGKKLEVTPDFLQQVRRELMRTGRFPLNVDGLLGLLAMPQVPGLVITTDITTLPAQNYPLNAMAVVTGTPADTLYYNKADAAGNHIWTALHASGPTDMMTTDTAQNVTGAKTFTVDQIMQGKFSTYANLATGGLGLAVIVAVAQGAALSAAVGTTNLLASAPLGTYRMSWYLVTTTVGNPVTVDFKMRHTFNGAAHADTLAVTSLWGGGGEIHINTLNEESSGSAKFKVDAATPIAFETVIGGALGAGRYAIDVVLERFV